MNKILFLFMLTFLSVGVMSADVSESFMLTADADTISVSRLSVFIDDAEAGNPEAQRLAGLCYLCGKGVEPDGTLAWKWIAKSAGMGDHVAQYYLGMLYVDGVGVKPDSREAAYWFRKAGSNGQCNAQRVLGDMFLNGTGVLQDARIAAEWYWRAATQGDVQAQYKVAGMYRDGIGVERNLREARKWFEKAAKAEYLDAAEQASKLPGYVSAKKTHRPGKASAKSRKKRK